MAKKDAIAKAEILAAIDNCQTLLGIWDKGCNPTDWHRVKIENMESIFKRMLTVKDEWSGRE